MLLLVSQASCPRRKINCASSPLCGGLLVSPVPGHEFAILTTWDNASFSLCGGSSVYPVPDNAGHDFATMTARDSASSSLCGAPSVSPIPDNVGHEFATMTTRIPRSLCSGTIMLDGKEHRKSRKIVPKLSNGLNSCDVTIT
ncbi:hypothetical protein TNCV_2475561 [Trichonephila clavipes]|nr:hypothetical protein TNCV_2475561 [Trichonephila clavipes]